ncbi:hypothetical protein LCGC14_1597350 [marine sediment metagenome]|uniref:Anti-CBASS protein Acb1-like N-terminal domain-containing protein n=1 Tax=marine sediment metagenome TaxID=412755 RepID=A0A0F9ICL3_9ZZZZ
MTAKVETQSGLARLTSDAWENVTSGHGTLRDRRTQNRVRAVPTSLDRQRWEDLYFGDDMAAKIVDLPIEDMVREWITISVDAGDAESDSEAEGERGGEAKENAEIADDMLQFLGDLKAKRSIVEAMTWAKVFGGGMILIGVDDGGELFEPLNPDGIRSFDGLTVYDRWEVELFRTYETDDKFGEPEVYRIVSNSASRGGAVQPERLVHETRMIRFNGIMTNRRRQRRNDGWDDSVFIRIEQVLGDFGISWASTAILLSDFSQAVFKMKGLADAVASSEGNLVLERMLIMDTCRSTVRAVPIDADDEDFERHATPVTGLSDLLEKFMLRLSAAARMPVTLLFGQSAAGMSATGEGDQKLWDQRVSAMQETDLRDGIERIVEVAFLAPNGPTSGTEPEGWSVGFNPLDHPTEKEQAENRLITAKSDDIYISNRTLDPDEVRESRFGGETYSTDTSLNERDAPDPETDAIEKAAAELAAKLNAPPVVPSVPPPEPDANADAVDRDDRIEKRGRKYTVLSSDGKVLGEHDTHEAAAKQLRAIEINKET